jgi:thiosulfate/3-mercaptopyruvate sulfurtransferase
VPNLGNPDWVIVDCQFALDDPEYGRREYIEAHIPGAVYAHLDEDLCSPWIKGVTGRHPLPSVAAFTDKLARWGIDAAAKVVAYDDAGGSMAAARFWWLMRWLGHYAVAVLDGGWQEWLKSGQPVRSGVESRSSRIFIPRQRSGSLIETDELVTRLEDPRLILVDSRAGERYRGEVEPIDPIAGHIPGAFNAPHLAVLDERGKFLSPSTLRAHFTELLGKFSARDVVFYCGSGVTAVQNILAVAHAGLGDARLYPGSWSEWITDPGRPVATKDRY